MSQVKRGKLPFLAVISDTIGHIALFPYLVLLDDVHDSSPSGGRVPVHAVHQRLRHRLEEVIGAHVGRPQGLAHA